MLLGRGTGYVIEVEPVRAPDYSALAAKQVERLTKARAERNKKRAAETIAAVKAAAESDGAPLMEPIIDAVRARATLGEIAGAMESVWGRHDRNR